MSARLTVIMGIKAAEMETTHTKEVRVASNKVEVYGPDMDEWDPWNPPYPQYCLSHPDLGSKSHAQLIDEVD